MISESEEQYVDAVRAIMGEHFHNFAFAVMDDEGNLHYDYTNYHVGRMLFNDSLEDMHDETGIEVVWAEDEEEGEDYE